MFSLSTTADDLAHLRLSRRGVQARSLRRRTERTLGDDLAAPSLFLGRGGRVPRSPSKHWGGSGRGVPGPAWSQKQIYPSPQINNLRVKSPPLESQIRHMIVNQ